MILIQFSEYVLAWQKKIWTIVTYKQDIILQNGILMSNYHTMFFCTYFLFVVLLQLRNDFFSNSEIKKKKNEQIIENKKFVPDLRETSYVKAIFGTCTLWAADHQRDHQRNESRFTIQPTWITRCWCNFTELFQYFAPVEVLPEDVVNRFEITMITIPSLGLQNNIDFPQKNNLPRNGSVSGSSY